LLRFDINLLFTVINVLILYVLLRKFLFGRVNKILEARQQMIEDQLAAAAQEQEQANALKAEYEHSLASAKETSAQMLTDARTQAKQEYDRIVASADGEAADLIEQARGKIETERQNALRSLEGEISDLALQAAERVIGSQVSPEINRDLYDQFLKEAGDRA
jgi:F-type H+-transporting ATPase subunit b